MKSRASLIVLSLMLSAGFIGADVVVAPQAAVAAAKKTVGPKVGAPLQAALGLMKQNKFKEAIGKAEEANAVEKKSAYETFMVNEVLGGLYVQTQQYDRAAGALEASLATGEMAPEETSQRIKQLAQIYYQNKNYPKAIEFANRYNKEVGADADLKLLVGQSYYLQKNYKQAAETIRDTVRTAEAAKRPVKEEWLQLLMSSEYEQGNEDGVASVLEQLVTYHPSDKYWKDLLQITERKLKGGSVKTSLDIYRVRLAAGALTGAQDYTEMAELALQEALPGEAKMILEKGNAAGVLGAPDKKEREARLLTMANTQADADLKSLAAGEAEARNQKTGDALVKFGEAYWTYGQHAKAVELIQAGIAKGVKNADEAKLRLGIAQISAGQRPAALETFKGITAGTPTATIARLWTLQSQGNKKA